MSWWGKGVKIKKDDKKRKKRISIEWAGWSTASNCATRSARIATTYHLPISFSFFSTQNKTKRTVASETQRVSEAQSQRHGAIVFCFNRELASCPRNHPCAVLVLSNKHIYKLCTVSFYIDHSSSSMHANLVSNEMSHATSYINNFHKTNY